MVSTRAVASEQIYSRQALREGIVAMSKIPEVLPRSIPIPEFVIEACSYVWYHFIAVMRWLPGGRYIIEYVRKSHQDDPYRTIVEILLIIYGIIYYFSKPQQKKSLQRSKPNLTPKEIDALIEEWVPEPIVDTMVLEEQRWRLAKIPVIQHSGINNRVNLTRNNGAESFSNVLNLCSNNFLQLSSTPEVLEEARKIIKNYGVGACGPAGFYGNQDVHFNLEYELADFFGTEAAVLYGQDFCVAPSAIPAFTKRGDLIVADNHVSLSVQNALQLSRSTVYYFDHNDMESLENLLIDITESEKAEHLPATPRKFIVTEGLFHNSGDIANLPKLTALKLKYKFRLVVDETFSIGVLGSTGRGIAEHFNMERSKSIDMTVGSLATALGSSGAFVLGDKVMAHHQRIGSNAYCFSASLPPYAIKAADKVLEIMNNDNSTVQLLQKLSKQVHQMFSEPTFSKAMILTSSPFSPVIHLQLTPELRTKKFNYSKEGLFETNSDLQKKCNSVKFIEPYEKEEIFLQNIVDDLLQNDSILITRNTIVLKNETLPIAPSLKICINSGLDEREIESACDIIKTKIFEHCYSDSHN
ncbi:hypothetical protein HG535_0E00500 [Zygotorulaspora mrakii]|uniref:serine C-palmitoyltransferase n=1 Tax=Zygotorulaspora mrakii TaxID=42260 RepID=A0A7H9B3F4_ZYGMR|nr:uncharacterized protein HG535_0E00500 [Zygotorulaspora mrakii]QLG72966.1 hypothetical protein HG535_0E00500 [Zygotorulaspora mrakii]